MHFDIRLCGMCTVFAPTLFSNPQTKSPAFHPFECHPFWLDLGLRAADAVALVRLVSTQSVALLKALCFSTVFEHFRAICPFFFSFCSSGGMLENPLIIRSYGTFGYSPPRSPLSTQMAICAAATASLKRSGTKALTVRHVGQKEVNSTDCLQVETPGPCRPPIITKLH